MRSSRSSSSAMTFEQLLQQLKEHGIRLTIRRSPAVTRGFHPRLRLLMRRRLLVEPGVVVRKHLLYQWRFVLSDHGRLPTLTDEPL